MFASTEHQTGRRSAILERKLNKNKISSRSLWKSLSPRACCRPPGAGPTPPPARPGSRRSTRWYAWGEPCLSTTRLSTNLTRYQVDGGNIRFVMFEVRLVGLKADSGRGETNLFRLELTFKTEWRLTTRLLRRRRNSNRIWCDIKITP